jgi:hypothetical protein
MARKRIEFKEDSKIYTPLEIEKVLKISVNDSMTIGNNKGVYYYNIPCAFDIETTSFYIDENGHTIDYAEKMRRKKLIPDYNPEKRAIMYVWQFGINGNVIIGRTWQEFFTMLDKIAEILRLDEKRRLMVFVHNLSYEFQFMCKWVKWHKVFSIDLRKPIYAITENFIEFRCSYLLSGYSLANLSNQLLKYKVNKMVGDLDYSLMRNSKTELSEKEIAYCVNDVRVVMAYIQEKIENERGLTNLPITKTGYVRQCCKKNCLYLPNSHKRNMNYFRRIHDLTISNMNEFNLLQRAFCGGFTHANARYVDDIIPEVGSYDFTSSYPYVMVSEKFPMSRGVKVELKSKDDFLLYMNDYLCVFDVTFTNLICKEVNENPLSVSKCWEKSNVVENNGRVVTADYVCTTITNIDYNTFEMFYSWDSITISNFYVYTKQYLPTELVKSILDLYENKTVLKGVEGKEIEYLKSKEMINAVYGMSVTNPLRDEYIFDGEQWGTVESNPVELFDMLVKYNESKNRFLYYIWGIFVTAYARRNLFTGIYAVQDDYIYSDTDSIKLKNYEKHKDYFDGYNKIVEIKLKKACEYHNIDFEKVQPKTKEGKTKRLGVWDFEGVYTHFKTLGAKRYMVHKEKAIKIDGEYYPISITVSGVNKFKAIPYLLNDLARGDIMKAFDNFNDGLHVPPENSGKNLHNYIDEPKQGELTDYQGNTAYYFELSAVHLEPTSYDLSLAKLYTDYLKGVKTEKI